MRADDACRICGANGATTGAAVTSAWPPAACDHGTYFPPTLIEIADLRTLTREVFGPVLHVVRFREGELAQLLDAINATGYGLTHGIHRRASTRPSTSSCARIRAGNIYVNRNIIGAVVGVQPFGGDRLSGTGPKAGGPLYLGASCATHRRCHRDLTRESLPGPTGETNVLSLHPRGRVACVAATVRRRRRRAAASRSERARDAAGRPLELVVDPLAANPDAVLFAGTADDATRLRAALAQRGRPIVP